jgi:hypothetical protein
MKNKKCCNDPSCKRRVIGSSNGDLIVVNHFTCKTVENQIIRAKKMMK